MRGRRSYLCLGVLLLLGTGIVGPVQAVLLEQPSSLDSWQSGDTFMPVLASPVAPAPPDEPEDPATLVDGANPIGGAPTYYWWNGCSPTAGGMMIAWWDAQSGRTNLYDGNAMVWGGSSTTGTRRMVASKEHIDAGAALGFTYGSYQNHAPNSIADFMYTEDSGTYASDIIPGLIDFADWDNPATANLESHNASGSQGWASYYGGTFGWDDFTAEIDAGRPMLLNLRTYYGSSPAGHTVFAYGYEQYNGINWYAIKDTWSISGGGGNGDQSYWPEGGTTDNRLVGGVEWWPFYEFSGYKDPTYWAWRVYGGGFLEVDNQPEPATVALFGVGIAAFVVARRRRRGN